MCSERGVGGAPVVRMELGVVAGASFLVLVGFFVVVVLEGLALLVGFTVGFCVAFSDSNSVL